MSISDKIQMTEEQARDTTKVDDYTKELFAEKQIEINNLKTDLEDFKDLFERVIDHLDYCGWGDSWEKECSEPLQKEVEVFREKHKF